MTLCLGALFAAAQLAPPSAIRDITHWEYALIGVTYALSLVYGVLLRVRALVTVLGYAQIVLDTAIVTVLVMMTGGVESVFSVTYTFVVLGAAITMFRRGATIATLGVFVCYGTVVLLQTEHLIGPRVQFGSAVFAFVMHTGGMLVVALLASALTERLRITDQRLAEKKSDLEQLEVLHAAILRSLPAGLMTIDVNLTIRYANESATTILRQPAHLLIGHRLDDVVPTMAEMWRAQSGMEGSLLPGRSKERYEAEYISPDGDVLRIGFSFAPLGLTQEWSGSIVVFQDVTEFVRLKSAVERSQRLATVGKFAAGLAHEVRNPLAAMCASIDVLEQSIEPPDGTKRLMSNVVQEAARLNELITHFLTFARPRDIEAELSDLTELVSGVLELFAKEVDANIHVETKLTPDLNAAIDANQVRQVVWNLLRNAAEAMPEGGKLEVLTFERHGEAVFAVKDSGIGVPADKVASIFDPFFTTKQRGSGLGLAIAHSIIESHGGSMSFESQEGVGSRVIVRLPRDLGSVDLLQTWDESSSSTELEILTALTSSS